MELTTLQADILRTVIYFDIFRHPLTAQEIYRFLPSNSTSPSNIAAACSTAPLSKYLDNDGKYFALASKVNDGLFGKERVAKERRARRYLATARFMAHVIRRFPFVRGVSVSGELSKGVASKHGDIDYLIITANDRLWIARTLLIFFKKVFLFNRKKFFCLNHFVSERAFESKDRTLYTAVEIATLIPLTDYDRFKAYQSSNAWILRHFPNHEADMGDWLISMRRRSVIQSISELPFRGSRGDRLDEFLRGMWKRIWDKRYSHVPSEERFSLFRCEPDCSTSYVGDFLPKIMAEYRLKLKAYGLQTSEDA